MTADAGSGPRRSRRELMNRCAGSNGPKFSSGWSGQAPGRPVVGELRTTAVPVAMRDMTDRRRMFANSSRVKLPISPFG